MSDKYKENVPGEEPADSKHADLKVFLNDAASLLIQLEPTDFSELTRLRDLLKTIIADKSCPEFSVKKITRVLQSLEQCILNSAPPEQDILKEFGQLIEEAMNAAEAKEMMDHPPENFVSDQNSSSREVSFIPSDADPDLLGAFITESTDLITNAEEALLSLETDPEDMESISIVFRAFHTVKGTSAFLELSPISEMAHRSESFLSRIRDGEIRYTGGYTDLALRSIDMLKELIQAVQDAMGGKPFFKPPGYDELMSLLENPEKAGISDKFPGSFPPADEHPSEKTEPEEAEPEEAEPEEAEPEETEPEPKKVKPEKIKPQEQEAAKSPSMAEVAKGLQIPQRAGIPKKNVTESSVRVPVDRLDRFIDTVGELVVAHSMVTQDEIVSGGKHHELLKKVNQTSKIVRELQHMSMSMRMIPLKATFRKMARMVRDLARKAGKSVTFITEGEDTEIDRNMVDIINDPLVHMVRNAVDHGIEFPEIREAAGKPAYGTVKLSARHSAGNVVVEIRDDGKGLDREAILAKALEKGLVGDEVIKERPLNDQEVFALVFEPGFSTAEVVSEISGRGVGMNVVKANIEALRGQVEIQSAPGEGCLFSMRLPLTLAIIDGMVIRVGSERYVIPTVSIVRSVRPTQKDISTVLRRGETLTLQGKLIPLFRLHRLFGIPNAEQDMTRAIVMVVEDNGKQAGMLVDELIGSQQIVIKPLGEMMRNIPGISGSAIMPDGRVGLILDVGGLVRLVNRGPGDADRR